MGADPRRPRLRADPRPRDRHVLVDGDAIAEIVAPARSRTATSTASTPGQLVIPGLVNGHNHAQTNLAKGLFDRYTLETYLNAGPGRPGGEPWRTTTSRR